MILEVLEQHVALICVISPNSVAFGTDYVKVVKDKPILSPTKM